MYIHHLISISFLIKNQFDICILYSLIFSWLCLNIFFIEVLCYSIAFSFPSNSKALFFLHNCFLSVIRESREIKFDITPHYFYDPRSFIKLNADETHNYNITSMRQTQDIGIKCGLNKHASGGYFYVVIKTYSCYILHFI